MELHQAAAARSIRTDRYRALLEGADLPSIGSLFIRPAWMDRGACATAPGVDFFPDPRADAPDALDVCDLCTVRHRCLAWALDHAEVGVWGGTTERQRRAMRRTAAA